mgnify:FL=1
MDRPVDELLEELRRRKDVTFLELKAEPPEPTTFGYTDTQIRALTVESLRAQVSQSERLSASLQKQVRDTDARTAGLKDVLRRKRELAQE